MISFSLEQPIPFDNLRPDQLEERTRLQVLLRQLQPGPGQLLIARYSGPKHPKSEGREFCCFTILGALALRPPSATDCSLRNARRLLFAANIATRLRRPLRVQAVGPECRDWPNSQRYVYRIPITFGSTKFGSTCDWRGGPRPRFIRDPSRSCWIYKAPRSSCQAGTGEGQEAAGRLSGGLSVGRQRPNVAEACARLALLTGRPADQLRELLCDFAGAVLGTLGELLAVYRQGIKWNPDDHHCVAGSVKWSEGQGPNWTLSG